MSLSRPSVLPCVALLAALVVVPASGSLRAQSPVAAPDKSPGAIIRPAAVPRAEVPAPAGSGGGYGAITLVGALALAAGGVWMAKRGRLPGAGSRDLRHLAVEETRPLGNRQYLVVAAYDDKRFLIGVCPGRIEFLTALDSAAARRAPPAS